MSLFKKILVILALFVAAMAALLWPELKDGFNDWLDGRSPAADEMLSDMDLRHARGFTLRPEQNDIQLVSVTGLRIESVQTDGVHASFVLSGGGGHNAFPSLRVKLLNAAHQNVRDMELGPSDYVHSEKLEKERISLVVPVRSGEKSMVIEPFYPDGEAS